MIKIKHMIKIKQMKKSDIPILSKIYAEVYRVFNVGEKWTAQSAYKLLNHWFKRQPDLAFTAEYNGKIVGAFVSSIKPWWDGNHLGNGEIFVMPKFQKYGIGTELSKKMFKTAIQKYNVRFLDGFTFKKHKHPLSWYKSMGFHEIKEWAMISGDIRKALKFLENKKNH